MLNFLVDRRIPNGHQWFIAICSMNSCVHSSVYAFATLNHLCSFVNISIFCDFDANLVDSFGIRHLRSMKNTVFLLQTFTCSSCRKKKQWIRSSMDGLLPNQEIFADTSEKIEYLEPVIIIVCTICVYWRVSFKLCWPWNIHISAVPSLDYKSMHESWIGWYIGFIGIPFLDSTFYLFVGLCQLQNETKKSNNNNPIEFELKSRLSNSIIIMVFVPFGFQNRTFMKFDLLFEEESLACELGVCVVPTTLSNDSVRVLRSRRSIKLNMQSQFYRLEYHKYIEMS